MPPTPMPPEVAPLTKADMRALLARLHGLERGLAMLMRMQIWSLALLGGMLIVHIWVH